MWRFALSSVGRTCRFQRMSIITTAASAVENVKITSSIALRFSLIDVSAILRIRSLFGISCDVSYSWSGSAMMIQFLRKNARNANAPPVISKFLSASDISTNRYDRTKFNGSLGPLQISCAIALTFRLIDMSARRWYGSLDCLQIYY